LPKGSGEDTAVAQGSNAADRS